MEEDDSPFIDVFEDKVKDKKDQLSSLSAFNGYSPNELQLVAFDQVLTDMLHDKPLLKEELQEADLEDAVVKVSKKVISKNGGLLHGATLAVKDNRIYIRAANKLDTVGIPGKVDKVSKSVYQESASPEIDFLQEIWNKNTYISLG